MAHVPLRGGEDRVIGTLSVGYTQPRTFTEEERTFITLMANQCALALDRARLFEAEQAARREAERGRQIQERLMAIVGHDLRTPLSAIAMGTILMLRRGALSDAQRATLARISSSASRMNAIIRDLLDFSRVRVGVGISIHPEQVDLGDIARNGLLEFEGTEGDRRPLLAVEGDARLRADPDRLGQVVSNLVGNALRYGAGAPVQVHVAGREDEVVLEVHNEGPRIRSEVLPHLFEPFRRGDDVDASTEKSGSIGLGLFIVTEIVKAHGGTVAVRSEAASGTTFTVRLPREPPVAAPGERRGGVLEGEVSPCSLLAERPAER